MNLHTNIHRTWSICVNLAALSMLMDLVHVHNIFFGHDFRLSYVFILALTALLVLPGKVAIPKPLLLFSVIIAVHTVAATLVGGYMPWWTMVQLILIFVLSVTFYTFVRRFGLESLVRVYCFVATIVAVSVIIESLIYILVPTIFVGYSLGPWIFLRASGLMSEPSHVALVIPPAIFAMLCGKEKIKVVFLTVAALLTFSTLTYIALATTFVTYWILSRGIPAGRILILVAVASGLVVTIPPVRDRALQVASIPELVTNSDTTALPQVVSTLGTSVGASFIAAVAARKALEETYLLGVGFGNFMRAGEKLVDALGSSEYRRISNTTSLFSKVYTGGSVIIRLIGELGVIGVGICILFCFHVLVNLRRCRRRVRRCCGLIAKDEVKAIGIFVSVFTACAVRQDGYVTVYLIFPLMGYLAACRRLRRESLDMRLYRAESTPVSDTRVN